MQVGPAGGRAVVLSKHNAGVAVALPAMSRTVGRSGLAFGAGRGMNGPPGALRPKKNIDPP